VAFWFNVFMFLVYSIAMLTSDMAPDVVFLGISSMIAAMYATLKANLHFERDSRYFFLQSLQDDARVKIAAHDAIFDPLTGVHNRRYIDHFVEAQSGKATTMGVIVADIDHFKSYNDTFGHQAGDECLRKVANALSSNTRGGSGAVIRYGGEEFVILMPGCDFSGVHAVAERLRAAVEALAIDRHGAGESDIVTASFGVSCGPVSPDLFSELLSGADAALYAAKHAGRNRVWPPLPMIEREAARKVAG
jgi:diguanylate cyclase (GGDEF)-like protein